MLYFKVFLKFNHLVEIDFNNIKFNYNNNNNNKKNKK